jgi:hypothetical protein
MLKDLLIVKLIFMFKSLLITALALLASTNAQMVTTAANTTKTNATSVITPAPTTTN